MRMRVSRLSPLSNPRHILLQETPKTHTQGSGVKNTKIPATLNGFIASNELATVDNLQAEDTSSTRLDGNTILKSIEKNVLPYRHTCNTDGATGTGMTTIYVLGDEQIRNVGPQLNDDLKTKNERYNVLGMVCSSATSTEILKSCELLFPLLKSEDIVILMLGANDKNPYKLYCNLSNILHILRDHTVLVGSVQFNPYLSERKLNEKIKLLTNNYTNSRFIHFNFKSVYLNNTKYYAKKLSFKLHVEIRLLSIKITFKFTPNNELSNCMETASTNKTSSIKKGTIPYYFKIKDSIASAEKILNIPSQSIETHKKGTIPFYFQDYSTNKRKVDNTTEIQKNKQQFFRCQ